MPTTCDIEKEPRLTLPQNDPWLAPQFHKALIFLQNCCFQNAKQRKTENEKKDKKKKKNKKKNKKKKKEGGWWGLCPHTPELST